ncbi:MAG TPA: HAD-IC family P-type ATPase, partial [Trueperaceae bacterium]
MAHAHEGLSSHEAQRRLHDAGPNRLTTSQPVRFLAILREEITEPMILLLLAVAVGYFLFGERVEALLVLGIILGILFVEVWTEFRAKRAIQALSKLTEPNTRVIRDGKVQEVPIDEVVVGDLLLLHEGSRVPADAALRRADDLAVDESLLTGESLPVEKHAVRLDADTPASDQPGRVLRGTTITRGEATAEVIATGRETQLGQIADLAAHAKPPRTPLQVTLRELARPLVWVALSFAVLIPLLTLLFSDTPWQQAVLNGLSLAFATIPEELPILVTLVLGLGALRLAREGALVRGLRPAETLGHTTTVVTDKTGTLTENRMQLAYLLPRGKAEPLPLSDHFDTPAATELRSASYYSLGLPPGEELLLSDPLERALAQHPPHVLPPAATAPKRIPFTRERGWSGAVWPAADGRTTGHLYLKGPPETILRHAALLPLEEKQVVAAEVERLAGAGYRVLAVASTKVTGEGWPDTWQYLGLLVLE